MRNVGITISGITFIILIIKIGTDPDNKAKYVKLVKHVIIATVLITLALSLVEIPKTYFGSTVEVTDGQIASMTIDKIEDKDCQGREVVNINGKRYVVTDTNKKIAALTDSESLHNAFGLYSTGKVVENVSFLRPFNDCQGFWKGYYAKIEYYRDSDGFIFPSTSTYPEYTEYKKNGNSIMNSERRWWFMVDKKTIKIPTEIKLKTEFFDGYGMRELVKTIVVGAISCGIAYFIYLFTHQTLFATFFVLGAITVSVIFLIKGQNNFSMLDTLKNIVKYNLIQSEYKYMRGDFNVKSVKKKK